MCHFKNTVKSQNYDFRNLISIVNHLCESFLKKLFLSQKEEAGADPVVSFSDAAVDRPGILQNYLN